MMSGLGMMSVNEERERRGHRGLSSVPLPGDQGTILLFLTATSYCIFCNGRHFRPLGLRGRK